ncbi:rpbA [Aeromonas phage 31]|uniref:RNA polymerase binding protein n=5 Tax=Biquartavirus TaxID=1912143 RepID=Q6U9R1_9CAUD|nr:RNA polymerase binding [Aeromonas phage 44RR2.8t]YP_238769.1 RNA polymerase binding [Aeromonas phage 31]APU00514.1 RNA polymerase [Aeromonas phage 44RR2.8t.2]APU00935.1 RNA polymerase [Aeromonas phage 31.2]APU01845.1 RNA polymerase [Aeromonas phage L9-6]APU02096.1 RNA polymerase [Aeromonas phage Riv-10]APU02343.1 RNA polymerase [Aeromonas phage SW69-9]UYD59603.1 hypothetical protein JNMOADIG_00074 [Aeromonas phage avDM5]UYD60423.1 hypothetical protein NPHMPGLK_00088 [Aeromonas phage avDM
MRNQAIVVVPADIRPLSDNIYETSVKIRKAWVANISDVRANQLQAIEQSVRFELYAEIDNLVRDMYVDLLQRRRAMILANGGYHVKGMNDKPVFAKQFQYDTDELIITAAEMVMADY